MEVLDLSILIGTYNRVDHLRRTLEALIGKIAVPHEIVVIDAGSTDGTLDYLQQLIGVRVIQEGERIGQARSLNRVFKSLKSRYICWLSDDNVVIDGMLDVAVSILKKDASIGMVALKVKDVTGPHVDSAYLGSVWTSGVLNCNQGMLPTTLLQKLGGFNEEFRDYGIDADLTTRVLLEGYKVVYTKKVTIHHFRDHESDSWISKDARNRRLEMARDLYNHEYQFLLNYRRPRVKFIPHMFAKGLSYGLDVLKRFMNNNQVLSWVAAALRDWQNVYRGRFISPWDMIRTIGRPYHLVQSMPPGVRGSVSSEYTVERRS